MKAITPVIALVMLMLITIGLVGIAAVWFSGVLNSSTEKSIAIPMGGVYCPGSGLSVPLVVMVLNNGAQSSITAADIKIFTIDGSAVPPVISGGSIKPGEAKVVTSTYLCGGTCAGKPHDVIIGTSTNVVQSRVTCK